MAFKIESLQEMKTIANTLSQYSDEAAAETSKVVGAVEQLDNLISGQGVDEALVKLKDSVATNAKSASDTLKYVSLFIKSQVASYTQNEDDTDTTLSNVQNTLDNIVI